MTPFGTRLAHAIEERGRFCVGIDPHAALLHEWGLDDDVASLERFALTVVEAVAPVVGVVKPQSAFYERFGSRGIAVLERVVAESRAAGALVLMDAKRGDAADLAVGGLCVGCLRTIDEIVAWAGASDAAKRAVLARVAARRADDGR